MVAVPLLPVVMKCDHCTLPVPAGLVVEGSAQQFCCAGCKLVYETLAGAGLGKYYDIVEEDAGDARQATVVSGRNYPEFDHQEFTDEHVTVAGDLASAKFYLRGVHCAACVWLVEKLPRLLKGVVSVRLDLGRAIVELEWRPQQVELSAIASLLDSIGYPPLPLKDGEEQQRLRKEQRADLLRIAIAGALAGNLMGIAFALYGAYWSGMEDGLRDFFRYTAFGLATISVAWPGRVFFRGALKALRARTPNMDLPIALGLSAGYLGGAFNTITQRGEVYFESVGILVFLLLVGRYIQRKQQRSAYLELELLHALSPGSALRVVDGVSEEVPISALQIGDVIEVLGGDTVAADGELLSAQATVDAAVLTGESTPSAIMAAELVYAGTRNLGENIQIRVSQIGDSTRVGQLMKRVAEYARRPSAIVRMADKMSGVFTLVVMLLALITVWWWTQYTSFDVALEHAIALLVIACPCALGLATPLAVVAAVGRAARKGILVKGGDTFESLSRAGVILLDKTGTITQGDWNVSQWYGAQELRPLVEALENHSNHPFARALANQKSQLSVAAVEIESGCGIRGVVDGVQIYVGSPAWLAQLGADFDDELLSTISNNNLSPAIAWDGAQRVSVIALGDTLRADSAQRITRLHELGWQVHILSGDDPRVVQRVACEVGVASENAHGGVTPEAKEQFVRDKQKSQHKVVMVGDGWNDATALAAADIGVAVHGSAEASLAAADVFLSRPGLGGVVELLSGSLRTVRLIRRNLLVSLLYNGSGVALAMLGIMNPLWAAVFMPLSSLTVVSLAWRSKTFN